MEGKKRDRAVVLHCSGAKSGFLEQGGGTRLFEDCRNTSSGFTREAMNGRT